MEGSAIFVDRDHPCPFCGGAEFVAGSVGVAKSTNTKFHADDVPFGQRLMGVGQGSVHARLCRSCRHIDFFVPDYVEE